MAARTQPPASTGGQAGGPQVRGPMAHLKEKQGVSEGQAAGGAPLYEFYHITRLGSRIWSGHGAFWSLDPHNTQALEAMKQVGVS
jgi:hypothetical protein